MGKKNSGIKNLAAAIEALSALQEAKTEKASVVKAVVDERLADAKAKNAQIDGIITALDAAGKSKEEIAESLKTLGLVKTDIGEAEKALTVSVQKELDEKKTKSFYEGLGEIAILAAMFDGESSADNSYAPQPPTVVVVPEQPTAPVTTTVATPAAPVQSQWDRHCAVTRDIRQERFDLERQYKNGEISFGDFIKMKAALNMEAFSHHCDVSATKHRR